MIDTRGGEYVHAMAPLSQNNNRKVLKIIDGFESAFAIEVLASVAYIRKEHTGISLADTVVAIRNWSERKARLYADGYVKVAYEHLDEVGVFSGVRGIGQ